MSTIVTIGRRPLAAAILAVLLGACGALSGGRATPTPEPTGTPSPSATSRPTPSPTSAPPLTQSFTSTLHGISVTYPEGWTAQAATEPWTGAQFNFGDPSADVLYDPALEDHLFLSMASQPIDDSTPDEWVAEHLFECTGSEPATVDGASGLIGAGDCNVVAVTTDGRGYIFVLYTSGDEAWLGPTFDRAWFEEVLATVQLHPEDAVDTLPSMARVTRFGLSGLRVRKADAASADTVGRRCRIPKVRMRMRGGVRGACAVWAVMPLLPSSRLRPVR